MNKQLPILMALFVITQSLFAQNIGAYDWARSIGTAGGNDITWDLTTDPAGNVYIAGQYAEDTIDLDAGAGEQLQASNGGTDIFVAKYTPTGQLIWGHGIGGAGNDVGRSITLDADGNVWITGTFEDTVDFNPGASTSPRISKGSRDVFFVKFNSNGGFELAEVMGSSADDVSSKIACHPITGNIWICGGFEGTMDFDPTGFTYTLTSAGAKDVFCAQYYTDGNLVGARKVGGAGNDIGWGLSFDKNGNLLVCGVFIGTVNFNSVGGGNAYNLTSSNNSNDGFLAKYDINADIVWAKALGGRTADDYAINVKADTAGNIVVCGYYADTCRFHPGSGIALKVAQGQTGAYAANYDPAGNFNSVVEFGSPGDYSTMRDIAIDAEGRIYVTGYAGGSFNADQYQTPYPIQITNKEAFLIKYDVYGNIYWGHNITAGSSNATGYCLHVDSAGNILIGGEFAATPDLDPSVLNRGLSSKGGTDAFFARYFNCGMVGGFFFTSDTICAGETAELSAGANAGYTVGWYSDSTLAGYLGANQYTTPQLQNNTDYYLMDSTCGIKNQRTVTVLVNQLPVNTVTQSGATLTAQQAANINYQWIKCNGQQPVAGATAATFTAVANGDYALTLINTETGCSNVSTCYSITALAVDDLFSPELLNIYPNPANNVLNVKWTGSPQSYKVYNATGATMQSGNLSNGLHAIDVSAWNSGLYFFTVANRAYRISVTTVK